MALHTFGQGALQHPIHRSRLVRPAITRHACATTRHRHLGVEATKLFADHRRSQCPTGFQKNSWIVLALSRELYDP